MSDFDYTILTAVVMAVGLVGTIFPLVPGVMLIWAGSVLYGFMVGFSALGFVVIALLTVIVGVSVTKSVLVPRKMAEDQDVSKWSQFVAFVGAILGLIFIPIIGIVVGALIGLFVAELFHHREAQAAWHGTVAVAKGFGLSALIEVFLAMVMIAIWSVWAFSVIN